MRINTNALRKSIKTKLDASCEAVYLGTKAERSYPYAEYELQALRTVDERTQYKLEVNVYSKASAQAEEKADLIEMGFDHQSYMDTQIAFYSYRGDRRTFLDEDKSVHRVRMTFELYAYMREEE